MFAVMQIEKVVVLTDWFGEQNEYVGVLSTRVRAAKLERVTNTCQYCLRTGRLLYVEKGGSLFNMHCRDCLDYFDLMQRTMHDEDDNERMHTESENDCAYDDFEPVEHECMCCGSISYTSSHDGYCGACRSHEKREVRVDHARARVAGSNAKMEELTIIDHGVE